MSVKSLILFLEEDLNPEGCGKAKRKGNFWIIRDAHLGTKYIFGVWFLENHVYIMYMCEYCLILVIGKSSDLTWLLFFQKILIQDQTQFFVM